MFYHKLIGLLQTAVSAQELLECPDRPKLGQLTVVIPRWHRHIIGLYIDRLVTFTNLYNPRNRITDRRNIGRTRQTRHVPVAAVILLELGTSPSHHTDTSGIVHQL